MHLYGIDYSRLRVGEQRRLAAKLAVLALVLMIPGGASAQMIDWCAVPLPMQADTKRPMAEQQDPSIVWRLRCTIQKLDQERIEAIDKATNMEVRAAEAEAKLRAATEQKPKKQAKK